MDRIEETFDEWARNGRAEAMGTEHGKNVSRFLGRIRFDRPFTFLDVGCGNGWTVRMVAGNKLCRRAVGIDKSGEMISNARRRSGPNEEFVHTSVEEWGYRGRFDYVFAMESLYYAESVRAALDRIFLLLEPGGRFFCGTDFYSDNKTTSRWAKVMKVRMHLYSRSEWRNLFKEAGFRTRTEYVRDPASRKKWKREFGTLFITGTRPAEGNTQIPPDGD